MHTRCVLARTLEKLAGLHRYLSVRKVQGSQGSHLSQGAGDRERSRLGAATLRSYGPDSVVIRTKLLLLLKRSFFASCLSMGLSARAVFASGLNQGRGIHGPRNRTDAHALRWKRNANRRRLVTLFHFFRQAMRLLRLGAGNGTGAQASATTGHGTSCGQVRTDGNSEPKQHLHTSGKGVPQSRAPSCFSFLRTPYLLCLCSLRTRYLC